MSPARRRTIDLNGLFLDYPYSGTWTYTRNLTPALVAVDGERSQYSITVRHARPETAVALRARVVTSLWPRSGLHRRGSWAARLDKLLWEQLAWPVSTRAEIRHSLYFAAPFLRGHRLVVTIHDALPLRPEYPGGRAGKLYAGFMKTAARRANALIVPSDHARREVSERLDFPIERVFVTPEAPDPSLARVEDIDRLACVRKKYQLPGEFLLYLGGTERRKNLDLLVSAWHRVYSTGMNLVIVGSFPAGQVELYPDIPTHLRRLGLEKSVTILPTVAQEDLAEIYSMALGFCYPSRYEGFGLPPLEAMRCGTPVLASSATSLSEVLKDGAHLIHPDDLEGWSHAIERVFSDAAYRSDLSSRGMAVANCYSWTATARATVDVYDTVLATV